MLDPTCFDCECTITSMFEVNKVRYTPFNGWVIVCNSCYTKRIAGMMKEENQEKYKPTPPPTFVTGLSQRGWDQRGVKDGRQGPCDKASTPQSCQKWVDIPGLKKHIARQTIKASVYMGMAKLIATLSRDEETQHGCVLVDSVGRIISCGYNGPIAGLDDSKVPTSRPDKYPYMIHAETNAVLFAESRRLPGSTTYITGFPCSSCTRSLLQTGVGSIVYGTTISISLTPHEEDAVRAMCTMRNVSLVPYKE